LYGRNLIQSGGMYHKEKLHSSCALSEGSEHRLLARWWHKSCRNDWSDIRWL